MDDDIRRSEWLWLVQNAYYKDFAGKVELKFECGALMSAVPHIDGKLKVPRRMLPRQDFSGSIFLDCDTFSGGLVETIK